MMRAISSLVRQALEHRRPRFLLLAAKKKVAGWAYLGVFAAIILSMWLIS
jgi:hypothetical protein